MKLRVTFALFAFLTLGAASVAHAQMSDGEKKAAARAAYTEGVELQDKGRPADALGRFEAAQKLFDAPTHVLHIAECQALTGRLVEASETYETLIRKPLGKDAPDAFVQAQEQGKAELTQLRQRIPTMRVTIRPDPATLQNLQISVNDKQMPAELVGIARPVNPGAYKVTAVATGWGTPAPVDVDIKEKEAKSVDLALQEGQGAGATKPTDAPPAIDKPPEKTRQSPSAAGLLLGIRPGFFVPVGNVVKNLKFDDYASAGPGVGLDVIGRVARLFLVGGTLEFASLGAPNAQSVPAGTRAEASTNTIYLGVLAGIMPNVDKTTFVADANLGFRILNRTLTLTTPAATTSASESYSGLELGVNLGISIPAGPIRIVPKAGVAFGQFSSRSCGIGAATTTVGSCATSTDTEINSAFHTILNVALGLYYHIDFSRKAGSAKGLPFFTTASSK